MYHVPLYAILSGFEPSDVPGVGTFYDLLLYQNIVPEHTPNIVPFQLFGFGQAGPTRNGKPVCKSYRLKRLVACKSADGALFSLNKG
ncbi:hypothetical protein [Desulfofarcimen acetoxidans]|uniref:hypothetical protein n=1 Tax=Desulfofarcimen acetoxidans TaxID=58138 RepID=UPI00019E6478|nr:hypothetical protein [Desulfofarcimen acetoxidans]